MARWALKLKMAASLFMWTRTLETTHLQRSLMQKEQSASELNGGTWRSR